MPRKQKTVVPKLDMETPSLANIEYFVWKQQIENAKGDPAKLREIEEQIVAYHDAMLQQQGKDLLPLLDKHKIHHDDPNRWLVLAWFLAFESGKLTARTANAPIKWNDFTDRQLWLRVYEAKVQIAKETGCGIDSVPDIKACQRIQQDHPEWYKQKKGQSLSPSSLQKSFRQSFQREAARRLLARKQVLPT